MSSPANPLALPLVTTLLARVHLVAPDRNGTADADVQQAIQDMCLVNAFARKDGRADADGIGELLAPILGSMLGSMLDFAISGPNGLDKRVYLPWDGPHGDQPVDIVVR